MHFYLFFFGWRIMPAHHLPMITAKVSNEQRKEREVKRQDWKGKRRARSQLLDSDLLLCGLLSPSVNREGVQGTEFIKVRSSESVCPRRGSSLYWVGGEGTLEKDRLLLIVLQLPWWRVTGRESWGHRRPGFIPGLEDPGEGTATLQYSALEIHGLYDGRV